MIVLLNNVRSRHNVGSIFRTADALGVEKIYLCGYTPEPLEKVSLGAEKSVPFQSVKRVSDILKKLKAEGFKIYAIEQAKNSTPYYIYKPSPKELEKVALVLGNEVDGLAPTILKKSDKILEIPMNGEKESLNVSVAFGIVAFNLFYR